MTIHAAFRNRAAPILLAGLAILLLGRRPAWGAVGNVTGVTRSGDTVVISAGADTVTVEVCQANLLRVDYRPNGKSSPATAILTATNWAPAGAYFDTDSDPMVITTAQLRVEIQRTPCRLRLYQPGGTNLLLREPDAEGVFFDGVRLRHRPNSDFYGISGYNSFESSAAGLLRNSGGWVEAGYQGDAGAPLIWSRDGYGLLIDSDGGQFSVNTTNLVFEFCSRTNIEYYLMAGTPREMLAAVARVSGRPPMFPKWAMGFANSEWDINQSELTNIVQGYRQRQIPIDHYIVDFDWKAWGQDNYGEWRWNTGKFPGGTNGFLQAYLSSRGIHLSGILKPRIHVNTVQGAYATAHNFWWPGNTYQDYFSGGTVNDLNFSNPACRAWFWDHLTNSFSTGVQGWWNDEADQRGGGGGFFDNWQFMNMQKAVYEGQRGYSTQRVWSINRNFYLGAQRYAYAMWSGDIDSGFASMAAQRERMLSAISLGETKWGMDVGGFNGGNPGAENYARWIEFGALVPVFRVHGNQFQQRQPWVFGATAEAAAKAAMKLRYKLIPYIYSYEHQNTETGIGLVRPLTYDYPSDPLVANDLEAWMFGDYLLAAPVVQQGQTAKNIYLPAGTWFDYFRGTRYSGGQTIVYPVNSATWTDIPIFIKQGAIIPTQPDMNYVGETPLTNVYVDVFPGETPSRFTYYDDDGSTYAYESGDSFQQDFTAQQGDGFIGLDIGDPAGSYVPPLQHYLCRIYCPTNSGVLIDGTPATLYTNVPALEAAAGEGWAEETTRFGYAVVARLAAGSARSLVVSNNLVRAPAITPAGGTFAGSVQVDLSTATTGATIRFTTNGGEPDEFSAEYTAPILVFASTSIKARAFKEGREPSPIATAAFVIENNLLHNPGFEVAGVSSNKALYWDQSDPDPHGQVWGSAARVGWRSNSGAWEGTIRGTWAGAGNTGGFWQELPAVPGRSYRFSGWFWADSFWSSGVQGIKLEFLTGPDGGLNYLLAVTNRFGTVTQNWTNKNVQATAPAGAEWVRVVVFAENAGSQGALQFDDLKLEPLNTHALLIQTPHGPADPSAGLHLFNDGATITNAVNSPVADGTTQYVCAGWTMSGNDPDAGTSNRLVMTITNDAELAWLWTTNLQEPAWLSFGSATFTENETAGSAQITIIRTGGYTGMVSADVIMSNGTAQSGFDYVATNEHVVLADGVFSNTIAVTLLDDVQHESDETVNLALSNPAGGALLGDPVQAVLTIADDDVEQGPLPLAVDSEHGQPQPPAGTNLFDFGIFLSGHVTSPEESLGTQMVCAGWVGSGSVPVSPPPGPLTDTPFFALTNDSEIIWLWDTNYWFQRQAGPNGSVAGDPDGWYPRGGSVTVTATPLEDFEFSGWSGPVPPDQTNDNPLQLAMDQPRLLTAHFVAVANANLLNNPGFELEGSDADHALYWAPGEPDLHGDMWDTGLRVNWRAHSGTWQGAIRGSWANQGTEGGYWQEIPARPDQAYRFSAWIWADDGSPFGPWLAGRQWMKIEFFTGATQGDQLVYAVTGRVNGINQDWQKFSLVARSPATADWARVVIMARDVGSDGAMQVDDLDLQYLTDLPAPEAQPANPTNSDSFTAHWGEVAEASGYVLEVATSAAFRAAAPAGDLIISEYGCGALNDNDKYIEIFNGTGQDVDLGNYRIWSINNGGSWYESSLSLAGLLPPGQSYVIRNADCTSDVINARANLIAPNAAPMNFSGDDAIGLAKVVGVASLLLDAVGRSGADPGTGWGVDGVADATFDHTLVRKSDVRDGNPDWTTGSNEWAVLPNHTWTNLGEHQIEIGPGDGVRGFTELPLGGLTSLVVTGLTPGVQYFYRLLATNETGRSPYSATSAVALRALAPTGHASNIQFSGISTDRMTLAWINGDGSARLVVARATNEVDWAPADGLDYEATNDLSGEGGFSLDGQRVVFNGIDSTVGLTGLIPDTRYYFRIFEYAGAGVSAAYLTSGEPATGNQSTFASAYPIWAGAAGNGSIDPAGLIWVNFNTDTQFVLRAADYFHLDTVRTNGDLLAEAAGLPEYTSVWISVTASGNIEAVFAPDLATNQGTPHWWLAQHGLTNEATGFDDAEGSDSDTDGVPAWAEFVAGTFPTNGASVFRVGSVERGSFVIRWPSVTGRTYSIDFSTNLVEQEFLPLTSGLPATPSLNAWTDEIHHTEAEIFYRIRAQPEP